MKSTWNHIAVDNKKVKEFGYLIFAVFSMIIPLFSAYKNDWHLTNFAFILIISGLLFVATSTWLTKLMYPVYKSWMLLAVGLGFIMTRVIISIVYLFMITPIGVFRRLKGNNVSDTFRKFKSQNRDSYWIAREDRYDPTSTEKQY
jgi:hypothetical protein